MKLKPFMEGREAEVLKQLDDLKSELKVIRFYLYGKTTTTRPKRDGTIQERAMEFIRGTTGGLTSKKLSDLMEIDRTSLTPQLSRLRQKGELKQIEGKWIDICQ